MRWFSQIPTEFHLLRGTWDTFKRQRHFRLHGFHILWPVFPNCSTNMLFCNSLSYSKSDWKSRLARDATIRVLYTSQGLGCFHFARRYSGNYDCFLFLQVLRYFSSLGSLLSTYLFSAQCCNITCSGLPHSEIHGSKVASTYPEHFVGNHVLHRLLVPRHPPYALRNFNQKSLSIQINNYIFLRRHNKLLR